MADQTVGSVEQEQIIADHEATHGPLPDRIREELRLGTQGAGTAGQKAASAVAQAAKALHLEVVTTELGGPRALIGHALGMRLLIPAEGAHGPRETPALLYLFADAIALRPTDDSPMSAVPMYGLHIVMPHVAMARWVYKTGRTAHANVDLEREQKSVAPSLDSWNVDELSEADGKVQAYPLSELVGPIHVYRHLGLVRLAFRLSADKWIRLKSALPEPQGSYQQLWDLFVKCVGAARVLPDEPPGAHDDPPGPCTTS